MHPVDIKYLSTPLPNPEEFIVAGVERIVDIMKHTERGDIVMFINSKSEATKACELLANEVKKAGLKKPYCVEATGETVANKSTANMITSDTLYKSHENGPFERKIVMATNAIESSLTIDCLEYVIDSGWALVDSFEPVKMERRLLQTRISKAQAKQRTGRTGRHMKGICYRLYTEKEFNEFPDYPIPDIQRTNITDDVLRIMTMPGINTVGEMIGLFNKMIEPPNKSFIDSAVKILHAIGAIDYSEKRNNVNTMKLTELGKRLSRFKKVDVLTAKALITSYFYKCEFDVIDIAALLTEADGRLNTFIRDFRAKSKDEIERKKERAQYNKVIDKLTHSYGDIFTLKNIYDKYRHHKTNHQPAETKTWIKENYLNGRSLESVSSLVRMIRQELNKILFSQEGAKPEELFASKEEALIEDEIPTNASKNSAPMQEQIGGFNRIAQIGFYNPGPINLHDKREDNILQSLLSSYFIYIARKTGRGIFTNCFPQIKTTAPIARDSLLSVNDRGPKYILYGEVANILGSQKYNIVSKIPEKIIDSLPKSQRDIIAYCFSKEIEQQKQEPKYGFGDRHQHGSRDKRQHYGSRNKYRK